MWERTVALQKGYLQDLAHLFQAELLTFSTLASVN